MIEITCPECGHTHKVSDKCKSWSDYCWGCGKFFDWRLEPVKHVTPIHIKEVMK